MRLAGWVGGGRRGGPNSGGASASLLYDSGSQKRPLSQEADI